MSLYFTALLMLFVAVALIGGLIFASWLVVHILLRHAPATKKRQNGDKSIP